MATPAVTQKMKEEEKRILRHPTFGPGSLQQVSERAALPSTLGYRERTLLSSDALLRVEYGRCVTAWRELHSAVCMH